MAGVLDLINALTVFIKQERAKARGEKNASNKRQKKYDSS